MESFSSEKETILLTGITGYLGAHIGQIFVEKCIDDYNIRIAVRSLASKRHELLRNVFGSIAYDLIEFVEADLLDRDAIYAAVNGVKYIIHAAAPSPDKSDQSIIYWEELAEKGTKIYLEAATHYQVRKMVITGCACSAIGNVWKKGKGDPVYTEDDFAPLEGNEPPFK